MNSSVVDVLFVTTEDDAFAQMAQRLPTVTGITCNITRANSPEQALAVLSAESIDLCLLDAVLLDEQFADRLAALNRPTQYILIGESPFELPGSCSIGAEEFHSTNGWVSTLLLAKQAADTRRELAWRDSFEQLLGEVICRVGNCDSSGIDRGLHRVLAKVGRFLGADRAYVCLFDVRRNEMSNTHEWCAPGIPSQKHRVLESPLSRFRWFAAQICAGKTVCLRHLDELPPEARAERQEFIEEEIQSMACVPLIRGRQAIGFLGISAVSQRAQWRPRQIEVLQTVGKVFVNAIERKKAEDALSDSENRFRNVLDSLNDGLLITTEEGTIDYVNARFTELTGYPAEHVLGRKSFEVLLDDKQLRSLIEKSPTGQHCSEPAAGEVYQLQVTRDDGSRQWLEVKAGPYRNRLGRPLGTISALADVTERKQLETQLVHSQKMEAVGRLAGGVAHDFNNLLTAVLGYCGLLLNRLPPEHPHRRELLQIRKASDQASTLVQQLLTFSRKQVAEPAVIEVNAVVEDTSSLLMRLIGEDVDLVTRLKSDAARVRLDPGQLQQMIMNLAINARDAMPDGGTLSIITRDIRVGAKSPMRTFGLAHGHYIAIEVNDTGTGMADEVRLRLFEPFFTTKEQGKGTGLGLSTVYGIVKQAGGHIDVESKLGVGTTFTILLPCELDASATKERRSKRQKIISGTETILLVEDEDTVRNLLKEVLELSGYTVLGARHGRQALRVSERYRGEIHMVVTDVVMPYLGGRQLIERLRYLRPNIKTLVISGYLNRYDEAGAKQKEFGEFLSKPFTPYDFCKKIREILDADALPESPERPPQKQLGSPVIVNDSSDPVP